MRILIFISTFLIPFFLFSYSDEDKAIIAERLAVVLIKEYSNIKGLTLLEKIVMEISRGTFNDSIHIWKENYENIEEISVSLHPQLRRLIKKARLHDELIAEELEDLLRHLTFLGFKNIDTYYQALLEYDKAFAIESFPLKVVDEALQNENAWAFRLKLYEDERNTKIAIRSILTRKQLKSKLSFYLFAFDFLNTIREKIIEADIVNRKTYEKK